MYITPIFWIFLLLLKVLLPLSVHNSRVPETKAANSTQSLFLLHKNKKAKGCRFQRKLFYLTIWEYVERYLKLLLKARRNRISVCSQSLLSVGLGSRCVFILGSQICKITTLWSKIMMNEQKLMCWNLKSCSCL